MSLIFFICGGSLQAFDFTCIAMEEGTISEELYFRDSEDYVPIKLRSHRRSVTYSVPSVKDLFVFYIKGPIDQNGVQTYLVVGKVKVDSSSRRFLFLLDKREGHALPIGIFPVDDSAESFPASSFRFLNVTPHLIAIKFAEEPHIIASGESVTIQTKMDSEGYQPVHMVDQAGKTLFKSSWYVNPRVRELVIIHPVRQNRTKRVGLKLVSGLVPESSG